jgi:hypothetical protein
MKKIHLKNRLKYLANYRTELEAIRRAEILIDLLENNLTTPEEVNTRLIQS